MKYKKELFLSLLLFALLIVVFLGVTYAFFAPQSGGTSSRNVSVTSNTTDNLSFQISNDISFRVTQAEFASGGNNKSGEATAIAVLTPNNNTNSATMNYYMYLKMDSNPTVYSSANTNQYPELILQVFDSSHQLVTLTGLGNQVTAKGVTGYDITGKGGLITLLNNHQIVANNSATTETWRVVITLINLDVDQNDNTGKEISGSIIISKTATTYCELEPNTNFCSVLSSYNPVNSNSNNVLELEDGYIYYHDAMLTNGANDGSYRYAGANPNNYVCFGSDASTCPADNIYRIIGLIPVDVVTDSTTTPVTTETQMLYKIIKHDYLTSTELGIIAGNNSVTKVNFCPSNNLVNYNVEGFYWSGSSNNIENTWSSSTLNTSGLNGSYLTNLSSTWSDRIATVMWKVGGRNWSYIGEATPMSTVYTNEITNTGQSVNYAPTDNNNEYFAKVGLMYASDYGYSVPSTAWSTILNSYSGLTIRPYNWLYRSVDEWTITRNAYSNTHAFYVYNDGSIMNIGVYTYAFAVRPTFYLTKNTPIDMLNHTGTLADPYRIS